MDSMPALDTVFQGLNALYRNPDISGKEKASVWLGELQKSVFAWQIADQLLQLNQDVESCYFASQTMRSKIQYAFHELPQDSHESLRDSLLNHISKVTEETPAAIATQLCLALADLALQMVTWKNSAADLMQKFGGDQKHWHFLVELLTVIPEEINSRSLRLGANRRNEITQELTQQAGVLIQLLTAVIEAGGNDPKLQAKVFKCLGSWFSVYAMPQEHIVNSKLLGYPFHILSNKDCPSFLHEAASDCICNALYIAEDLDKNQVLAQNLYQGIASLLEAYNLSVAMEDLDKSINYCRIFTEMAESFLEFMVHNPNQGFAGDLGTLDLLLTCIGHHQYEMADITFNFWYRLSDLLYNLNNQALNEKFKPYIHRLVQALTTHCQFDPDHDGIPNYADEFVDFRNRVSELIKDVVFIVGSSAIFLQMQMQLNIANGPWEVTEAALFVMTAVARNIVPDEDEHCPEVLQAVLSAPAQIHVCVRYTSIQLVGELSEWIEKHPNVLDPVLQFLLSGLQNEHLATVAATALQKICEQCRHQMMDHFTGLLQIVQALNSFNVSDAAAIGLIRGTALILGNMPAAKVTEGMLALCNIQITPLNKILANDSTKVEIGNKECDPAIWLDRLAAIYKDTNPEVNGNSLHPCQPVIQETFPVLSNTCTKYKADGRIVERCCRCIRYAVRCLGKRSASLLSPLVTQMVGLYQEHHHSCFLYLGSILVDEYGTEQSCLQGLLEMLQAFSVPAFKLLEGPNGLRNHPDTIDDLFRLCLRFTQRAPIAFLQCNIINSVLLCAVAAVAVDHKEANGSVTKFISEFIKTARIKEDKADFDTRKALVTGLLKEQGQALTQGTLNASIFSLPSYMIPDVAEIIFELMLIDRPSLCVWLEFALKALPNKGPSGAAIVTHKQLTDFHKSVTSAEELKQVSRAMREFARLFR